MKVIVIQDVVDDGDRHTVAVSIGDKICPIYDFPLESDAETLRESLQDFLIEIGRC